MAWGDHRRTVVPVLAVACTLIAAPPAAATQRYASPAGAGDCSQANPCSIQTAVGSAGMGDEVIVTPGDYGSPTAITTILGPPVANVFVHGAQGQPVPTIHFDGGGFLELPNPGDRASHLRIEATSAIPLEVDAGAQADQLHAHSTGADACTVSGTLLDSVCWASGDGPNVSALETNTTFTITPNLRNVTLIASGTNSIGLTLKESSGGTLTATAVNVIARGTSSDVDVDTDTGNDSHSTLAIDHSNFATEATSFGDGASVTATNQQMADPLFLDAATGDFREAPGSPTIDAGVNNAANGDLDFEGDPRIANAITDIGADELEVPAAPGGGGAHSFAGVSIETAKARVKHRHAIVQVACPAAAAPPCAGTMKLTFKQTRKTLTAGSASFSIGPGSTESLSLKISRQAMKRLVGRGKLATLATASATDGAGSAATVSGAIKLTAKHRKRRS